MTVHEFPKPLVSLARAQAVLPAGARGTGQGEPDGTLYLAITGDGGAAVVRLLVEPTPDGGWDWLAWRVPDASECQEGEASTRDTAVMQAARAATSLLVDMLAGGEA